MASQNPATERKPRLIALGPLSLLRTRAAADPSLLSFISTTLPRAGGKPVDIDPMMPNLFYTVEHLMTDQEFEKYGEYLEQFPEAKELDEKYKGSWKDNWRHMTREMNGDFNLDLFLREMVVSMILGRRREN
ncbi:hypothetical protein K469DRAFT_692048 [Zopfia rhizophila CBS 207.26]|uniref:Uncharacterized protein n=1 Tax=Zopfia rhizophila CBS 207.26 TaxID=1314779 RepID=A0A6A6DTT9_9PEZI|nr:hypothetical protein K469DRAFT_692048 [Zopfia rhizophila CBS 207.26]